MNSYKLDLEKYAALARQAVAEGVCCWRMRAGTSVERWGEGCCFWAYGVSLL